MLDLDQSLGFEDSHGIVDARAGYCGDAADVFGAPGGKARECHETLRLVLFQSELL